jgi:hypothetical protein
VTEHPPDSVAHLLPPAKHGRPARRGRPKSVIACEGDRWSILLTSLDGTCELRVQPFRCRSWRCERCRWGRNQDDARLIRDIIELSGGPGLWVYTVLTFDQRVSVGRYEAFQSIYDQFRCLTKRLRRRFGDVQWISTVEQHASGWPHINVLFYSARMVERHGEAAYRLRDDIRHQAVAVGFGCIVSRVEPIDDVQALSGYIVKVADQAGRVGGEMSKPSQLPLLAPPRFRRLRISRGLERPPKEEKRCTGKLERVSATKGHELLQNADAIEQQNCALSLLKAHGGEAFSIVPSARHDVAGGAIVDAVTGEIHFSPDPGGPGAEPPVLSEGRLKGRCPRAAFREPLWTGLH